MRYLFKFSVVIMITCYYAQLSAQPKIDVKAECEEKLQRLKSLYPRCPAKGKDTSAGVVIDCAGGIWMSLKTTMATNNVLPQIQGQKVCTLTFKRKTAGGLDNLDNISEIISEDGKFYVLNRENAEGWQVRPFTPTVRTTVDAAEVVQ